ncbi:MAG: hypothetical protein NTZ57_09610 [Deltaproteobacteria bacterium]|jgi:hypothetical protein|nr:hypothetical protein [Deltaproteobacteria bacterium]
MARKGSPRPEVVERIVSIKTVDGGIIRGKINVGEGNRISDVLLTSEAPFIVIYDVEYPINVNKVLIINKQHIIWVEPEDTPVQDA